MSLEQRIYDKLQKEFQPEILNVMNESALHAGHAGDDGSGESHFKIEIKAETLTQMPYVQRERALHKVLHEEIENIHAISFKFM